MKKTARYDPASPIETLFEQIVDGATFAKRGDRPFTAKQVVDTALLCVAKTGVFLDDIKEWNRKTPADRTWKIFKIHFVMAHCEWKAGLYLTAGQHFP